MDFWEYLYFTKPRRYTSCLERCLVHNFGSGCVIILRNIVQKPNAKLTTTPWRLVADCKSICTLWSLDAGERDSGTLWTETCMDRRICLDVIAKRKIPFPSRETNSGRPARSQSLYCLSYPDRFLYFFIYSGLGLHQIRVSVYDIPERL
jgi:hypothetical protein